MINLAEKSKEVVKKSFVKGKESIKHANEKRRRKNDPDMEEGDCKLLGSGDGIELDQDMGEMTELKSYSTKPIKTTDEGMGSMSSYSKLSGSEPKSKQSTYEQEMKEVSLSNYLYLTLYFAFSNLIS